MSKPVTLRWEDDDKAAVWSGPSGYLADVQCCYVFRAPGGAYGWQLVLPGLGHVKGFADSLDTAKTTAERAVNDWLDKVGLVQKE